MIIENHAESIVSTEQTKEILSLLERRGGTVRGDIKQLTLCYTKTLMYAELKKRHALPDPTRQFGISMRFEHAIITFTEKPDTYMLLVALYKMRIVGKLMADDLRTRTLLLRLKNEYESRKSNGTINPRSTIAGRYA